MAVKQYMLTQGIDLNIDIEIDRNQTQGNKHKETFTHFLQNQLVQNPNLTETIKNTYKEDYALWKEII